MNREHAISLHEARIKSQGDIIKHLKEDNERLKRRFEDLEQKNRGMTTINGSKEAKLTAKNRFGKRNIGF